MGRQIVYCEGCGHNLREDDFEKGRARMIDNRPFCTDCRPYQPGEVQGRRPSSGKVPAQSKKNSTGAIPIIGTPRRGTNAASPAKSNPMPVIAGVGGLVLVGLIIAVTQGSSRKPVETVTAPPSPPPVVRRIDPVLPPPPPPSPPPPPVRVTPPPPTGPLIAPTASEKLDAFLGQIRTLIQSDPRFERSGEILNMFSAAAKTAGPRSTEVEKMRADYVAQLDEPTRRAAAWSEWHLTSAADPNMTLLLPSHNGRDSVQMTHPLEKTKPAKFEREVDIPAGKKTTFSFWVSCHQQGDFELRVYAGDKQLVKEPIGPPGSGWRQKTVDLTPFAGKRISLRIEHHATDWSWEHGYWSDFQITSE